MKHLTMQAPKETTSTWGTLPDDTKRFTVLDAIDEITDAQMTALARAANPLRNDSFSWTDLGDLYLNLERIRKAVKGRMK